MKTEIEDFVNRSSQKESQIEKYILRRTKKFPTDTGESGKFEKIYWKCLVYEMLFMWNAMTSCSVEDLKAIVEDCQNNSVNINEPSLGISKMVLGASLVCLKKYSEAIDAYRECIELRKDEFVEDVHISAFAHYELAMLLIKHKKEAKDEAKSLLTYAQQNYKNYDFDNRINVRIHSVLKKLT
jgi:tetratricopeptide (TPR) repeat protein